VNEPFGHSILEALAMKVPVVAPNRGGHTEILRHYKNGVLFDWRSVESLSTELIRLLSNPAIAAGLAQEGRKTIEALDISTHAAKVAALYDDLLKI
jgi:glycosyltransferase involved in cell wall biosynthesis